MNFKLIMALTVVTISIIFSHDNLNATDLVSTARHMSYTKLDSNGKQLPKSAAGWVMVRDNNNGLVWEVKQNKDGSSNFDDPHDADNRYTWYSNRSDINEGCPGAQGYGTDSEDCISALNSSNFGGYNNWRLPTLKELSLLTDLNIDDPAIAFSFFPKTNPSYYWSSTSGWKRRNSALIVCFDHGFMRFFHKSNRFYVRAVRTDLTN